MDTLALVVRAEELEVGARLLLRWAPPGSRSLAECGEAEATVTGVQKPKPRPLRLSLRGRWGLRAACTVR